MSSKRLKVLAASPLMNVIACFPALACGARTVAATPDPLISSLAGTHPGLTGFLQVSLFIFGLGVAAASFIGRGALAKMAARQSHYIGVSRCSEA
jgi:hypothetical protein